MTVESNEILGIVNRPTTLNCQVDGHPLPTISWTRAARPIDTQPGESTAAERTKADVHQENDLFFFSLLLSEVVFFQPYFRKFELNEGNQRVEEDTERFFSSQLFTGFQVLTNGSLRIHHLQIQDTGYYLCWAENLVRRTYAQIRLEVQGRTFSSSLSKTLPRPSSSTINRSSRTLFHRRRRSSSETLLSSHWHSDSDDLLARRHESLGQR